jgi:hypothetical protein
MQASVARPMACPKTPTIVTPCKHCHDTNHSAKEERHLSPGTHDLNAFRDPYYDFRLGIAVGSNTPKARGVILAVNVPSLLLLIRRRALFNGPDVHDSTAAQTIPPSATATSHTTLSSMLRIRTTSASSPRTQFSHPPHALFSTTNERN